MVNNIMHVAWLLRKRSFALSGLTVCRVVFVMCLLRVAE